jgi:hypothetical protein
MFKSRKLDTWQAGRDALPRVESRPSGSGGANPQVFFLSSLQALVSLYFSAVTRSLFGLLSFVRSGCDTLISTVLARGEIYVAEPSLGPTWARLGSPIRRSAFRPCNLPRVRLSALPLTSILVFATAPDPRCWSWLVASGHGHLDAGLSRRWLNPVARPRRSSKRSSSSMPWDSPRARSSRLETMSCLDRSTL